MPPIFSKSVHRSTKSAAASTCDAKPFPAPAAVLPPSHAELRYTVNRSRSRERSAAARLCVRTHGGFPTIAVKPPSAAASAKPVAKARR